MELPLHVILRRLPASTIAFLFVFVLASCERSEPVTHTKSSPTPDRIIENSVTFEAPPLGEFINETELDPLLLAKLDRPEVRRIEQMLEKTIVPRLELTEVTFLEALDAIQQCSVEYSPEPSPERRGISLIVDRKGDWRPRPGLLGDPSSANDSATPTTSDPFATTEAPAPRHKAEKPEPRFSEVYVNRSIRELLDEVAGRFSCWVQVEPYAVRLHPNSTPKPAYATVAFAVAPDFLSGIVPEAVDPFVGEIPAVGERKEARAVDALIRAGVTFPGISNAVFDEANSRLIVRAPIEDLELVSTYLQRSAERRQDSP